MCLHMNSTWHIFLKQSCCSAHHNLSSSLMLIQHGSVGELGFTHLLSQPCWCVIFGHSTHGLIVIELEIPTCIWMVFKVCVVANLSIMLSDILCFHGLVAAVIKPCFFLLIQIFYCSIWSIPSWVYQVGQSLNFFINQVTSIGNNFYNNLADQLQFIVFG